MRLNFTKMHGLGNDFVIISNVDKKITLTTQQISLMANRNFGIGCDQLLIIEPSADADFLLRIFNQDGIEAEQCGNGLRCAAKFIHESKLSKNRSFSIETVQAKTQVTLEDDGEVTAILPPPNFVPHAIPFAAKKQAAHYKLQLSENEIVEIGALSLGNPHVVLNVENLDDMQIDAIGKKISTQRNYFPNGVNVNFMQVIAKDRIRLRVYERGCGETLACGSGACAAVVIGRLWQLLNEAAIVELRGGNLQISHKNATSPIVMKGPAEKIFEGKFDLRIS